MARSKGHLLSKDCLGLKELHSYKGEQPWETRLQLAEVVLKMTGVLGLEIVHRKSRFSVVQGHVLDQILSGCPAPFLYAWTMITPHNLSSVAMYNTVLCFENLYKWCDTVPWISILKVKKKKTNLKKGIQLESLSPVLSF